MNIIVKRYEHFNTALPNWTSPKGVYIKNQEHYDRLVKENGMISYEESMEKDGNREMKRYVPSQKAIDILKAVKSRTNSTGKVTLDGNTIKAMKEIGAFTQKPPDYMKTIKEKQKAEGFSV